jgi:hypothetical protein
LTTRRNLSLAITFLIIATTSVGVSPAIPTVHSAANQTNPDHTWTDALSGGVWARLNHISANGSILDSAQAEARFGALASSPASDVDPPILFTNNFRVTGNSSLFPFEDEPSIAVRNQTSQFLMVVGANSLSTGQMVSYVSTDQGTHWSTPTFLPFSKGNDSFASDPALGVDRAGIFYYSFLSLAVSPTTNEVTSDDVVVATSSDGVHWINHVAAQRKTFPAGSFTSVFYDKDYLAVGPNKSNPATDTIYVTYTNFTSFCSLLGSNCMTNATIMQVHSTNSGVSWSSPVRASPTVTFLQTATAPRIVQGSMPAVASNGDLYIAYFDTGTSGFLNSSASVMITRSVNGGTTLSPPVQAALIPHQLTFASEGSSCCFRWWSSMFPSLDIAPDGTVYIAYGARQSKFSADPADVYLVASIDGGATWGPASKINDDSGQNGQFFAWIKVSTDNVVHIVWGDERLDPTGIGYDIFYAAATHSGITISVSANVRVTDVGTDPFETIGFVGDYFNLAVSGNQTYPVWTDGRRGVRPLGREILIGETDIYTARLGTRDAPSITVQATGNAGYQGPVTITATGLPRESYFTAHINGIPIISESNLIRFFFSTRAGNLSDTILPVSNYYGAYSLDIDEWVSGTTLATTNVYEVDTRPLHVSINGPSSFSPGDTVKWTIQLIPTGSAEQGYSTTYTVNQALVTFPNGSTQDVTNTLKVMGPAYFTITIFLPLDAPTGSYVLTVNASETGTLVRSNGVATATLTITSPPASNAAAPLSTEQMYTIIVGVIAAIGVVLQVIQLTRRRSNIRPTALGLHS